MAKKSNKKYGRLVIDLGYIVDMNNADMIEESKRCFYEDLMNSQKYDEMLSLIDIKEDKKAKESDIPEHIVEIMKI